MSPPNNDNEKAAAREGYRAALQMINYEGRLIWAVFSAMLAANAFVAVLAGVIASHYPKLGDLRQLLPWLGIGLCVIWLAITARQFGSFAYWFAWARHHERLALGSTSGMFQVGKRFADDNEVSIGEETARHNRLGRLVRAQWLIYTVIVIFISIYLGLFFGLQD